MSSHPRPVSSSCSCSSVFASPRGIGSIGRKGFGATCSYEPPAALDTEGGGASAGLLWKKIMLFVGKNRREDQG